MPMRPWNQLLDVVFCQPLDQVELEGVAEMGFAAGGLIRQFSRQYWLATKVGAEGKDYLKHRVMTFGADLSPEAVAKRGLPSIFELERRLDKIHLSPDFKQRVGIILNLLERHSEAIRMQRHNFMAGFWSGYALQGWDRESEADDTAVREEETAHE